MEKPNKLIYIYINQRVPDQHSDIFVGNPVEKSTDDQLLFKEAMLNRIEGK